MLAKDDLVRHSQYGTGRVIVDNDETVVVRFQHGIEECLRETLSEEAGPLKRARDELWDAPLEVVMRTLAESICSVNDQWGVFSLSRINLLPHQLWVCRKVLESWPTRWLVADDVGLGKTIEAGLILWPLLSRGTVRRLLVLCPASLVEQWQYRLRTMFDIRLSRYVPEADTPKADFWHTSNQVVASLQTLRGDHRERHQRMLDAPPWDLLIVDEAHHLNVDEQAGPTRGFRFVEKLVQNRKVESTLFFTGTPHRGKNHGFLSLLSLLRPEWFDPEKPLKEQLGRLSQVMIRNNKQCVTDLQGKRLFQTPRVDSETYAYSPSETQFYNLLTEFITSGKAYAASMASSDRRMATLVLIAMQKLASSSVAAIRRALEGRIARITASRRRIEELEQLRRRLGEYVELQESSCADELNQLDEELAEKAAELRLMEDEEPRLKTLLQAAASVDQETKITTILSLIERRFTDKSVLFFTEYKATQSLLMSALMQRYGNDCVLFINGDGEAHDVRDSSGASKTLRMERDEAADRFNRGDVRFLVSTEAAGEGIDLQRSCHCLVHVDLPWNPMRMHQRVGRLNRYGQNHAVEVVSVRNPDTVESRVWSKLTEKLENITLALRSAMAEPEDLQQLVLGMASPMFFSDLYAESAEVSPESFSNWFNERTARFGDADVLDTVRQLVGHSARFDFQQTSNRLPKVDLGDLKPFFAGMVAYNGRRIQESEAGISFLTPEPWLTTPRILKEYKDVEFLRTTTVEKTSRTTAGVGHVLVDEALKQARAQSVSVTALPSNLWPDRVFVFRITDKVTTTGSTVRSVIVGIAMSEQGEHRVVQDWQIIQLLNKVLEHRTLRRDDAPHRAASTESVRSAVADAQRYLLRNTAELDLPFAMPEASCVTVLYPAAAKT